jgi:hypothetical protein
MRSPLRERGSIDETRQYLHPAARCIRRQGLEARRGNIYLIVKLGKCTATKLVKGTGESPSAGAAEIPNFL